MSYKVLVVDDSSFFQHRLKEIIDEHPDLKVAGIAANGQEAVELAKKLQPDVISMDYEMPYMDGVSAIKAILAERNVPIVMFSSLSYEGAQVTLDALAAGAVDFIPKNFSEFSRDVEQVKKKLHNTLLTFARKAYADAYLAEVRAKKSAVQADSSAQPLVRPKPVKPSDAARVSSPSRAAIPQPVRAASGIKLQGKIDLVVIGASTGGPVALTDVLVNLPNNFKYPIVVIQHMPENFTKAFADRLNKLCQLQVAEAQDGDQLTPGKVLVAPGGRQCLFDRRDRIKIRDADTRVNYRPCVDITFASAANVYGGRVLGIVMTGMGSDGCDGARLLKEKGAAIWGQDQASSVVYGMPKAVADAQLVDLVLPLNEIGPKLISETQ